MGDMTDYSVSFDNWLKLTEDLFESDQPNFTHVPGSHYPRRKKRKNSVNGRIIDPITHTTL